MKRGVSPLIATVLLIGFVIVLAALIIRFGSELTTQELNEVEFQQDRSIIFDVDFDAFVIEDNQIFFSLTNNNPRTLEGFTLRIYFSSGELDTKTYEDIIPAYYTKTFTYIYTVPSIPVKAEIIPLMTIRGVITALLLSSQVDEDLGNKGEENENSDDGLHLECRNNACTLIDGEDNDLDGCIYKYQGCGIPEPMCELQEVYWSDTLGGNNIGDFTVNDNTLVYPTIITQNCPDGETLTLELCEDDIIDCNLEEVPESIRESFPSMVTVFDNHASDVWTTQWFEDTIILDEDPELRFNVKLEEEVSSTNYIKIKKNENVGFNAMVYVDALEVLHDQNPLLIGDNIHWVFSYEGLDENKNTIEEFYDLSVYAKEADLKLLRFPGGSIADAYHWKNHIGPVKERLSGNPQGNPKGYIPKGLIGTDEFMQFADLAGAESIFVINFGTGTPEEAADWVEYLNSPNDGTNPHGGTDWALERAKNGHVEPYGVNYFEIGNEIYAGMKPNTFFGHTGVEEYANGFNEFVTAMKEVDLTILTGAVGYGPYEVSPQDEQRGNTYIWNQKIMEIAGSNIDFFIEHSYAYGEAKDIMVEEGAYTEENIEEIAEFGLAYAFYQLDRLNLLQEEIGNQPLAITEHGSPFSSDYLSGLIMGSYLIETFKRTDIFLAPSFNLHEMTPHDPVGVIYGHILINQDEVTSSTPYPAYYTLKAFGQYTGDVILNSLVTSPTYDVDPFTVYPGKEEVPLVSVLASKSNDILYLAVLNRDLEKSVNLDINLDNFMVGSGVLHQLYNEELWENNEGALNVELKTYPLEVSGRTFSLTLPKHSLSIIELN